MTPKRIEYLVAAIVIILAFADFIPSAYGFRIIGQNILNQRLWLMIIYAIVLVLDTSVLLNTRMFWLYALFGIYILFEVVGLYDLTGYTGVYRFGWFRDHQFPLAEALILIELYRNMNREYSFKLTNLAYGLVVLISLTSIIIILRNPGIVRGTGQQLYSEDIYKLRAFGLGDYSFFSALPFLIPVMVYKIKNRLGTKGLALTIQIAALAIVILCSYYAVIVAPFLLSILVLVLAILGRRRLRANLAILMILVMVYIIVPKKYIGYFFYSASQTIENRDISLKLAEIGYGFTEGFELVTYEEQARTGIEGRASRIRYNIQDIISSPIIGKGKMTNAAHVFWLGLWAQFGLIGLIPMIVIIWLQIKRNVHSMVPDSLFTYYLSMGSYIILGFMKVTAGYPIYIVAFFLVPAMILQEEEWIKQKNLSQGMLIT